MSDEAFEALWRRELEVRGVETRGLPADPSDGALAVSTACWDDKLEKLIDTPLAGTATGLGPKAYKLSRKS